VKTSTAALELARSSIVKSPRRIHVAAGLYDAARGEQFPLKVPGGLSLLGAGSESTFIRGVGTQTIDGGALQITMMVGDTTQPTSISGFTLRPSAADSGEEYVGIQCERGDTVVANVHVDSGYVYGIKLDSRAGESASITVTGSSFDGANSPLNDSAGLFAAGHGCGSPWDPPATRGRSRTADPRDCRRWPVG
jgi:hypothetical protein